MGRIIFLRLLDGYFRHRWLYLLPVVLMTFFAGVYFLTRERLYISSGVLFTEQNPLLSSLTSVQNEGISWNTPAQNTANQISDLIKTDAFIRAVIAETDLEVAMSKGETEVDEEISKVREKIWVSLAGTNQVQINAANPDPRIAYQLAQATIDTFIRWKINLDLMDSVKAGDFFKDLIQRYRADVEQAQQALRSYLETHPQPVRDSRPDTEELEIKNLQSDLEMAGTRLAQALDKAEDARLAETQVESTISQKYTVVDAPDIPVKPATSRRQLAINAAVFVVAGVLLSAIALGGATVFDRSLRVPVEVQQALALPVLAIVPDGTPPAQKERFWRRKRKAPISAEIGEPIPEGLEEAFTLPVVQGDVPDPVQQKRSRRRKNKERMMSEVPEPTLVGPEDAPIMLDLKTLEIDFKAEQKMER